MGVFSKVFGTRSDREVKKIESIVKKITDLEQSYREMPEEELKAMTGRLKERYAAGESLDDLLPEAFATVREAADRVLGLRPYKVQLIGGIVLHQGRIAEMKTGEGKTLVATLPAYLNALTGEGVHVVTVNDYLAKRDAEWMGKIYRYLGLSVGLVIHGISPIDKKRAYDADITYCTNSELGFDYLRDNMAIDKAQCVQRGFAYALVDEVDSILIDEARTPLIISGAGDKSTDLYEAADEFVKGLKKKVFATTDNKSLIDDELGGGGDTELDEDGFPVGFDFGEGAEDDDFAGDEEAEAAGEPVKEEAPKAPPVVIDDEGIDYVVDEKAKSATLTAQGIARAERFFDIDNLSDPENATLYHHINQALKAHGIMKADVDYVVQDGKVLIVDEYTGRIMYGRRYNQGLHQAIEAKEGVTVENENKTRASITYQNLVRIYPKLAGMTGTAMTEEEEFGAIYGMDIIEIPTNKPIARIDYPDSLYRDEAAKYKAIVQQIRECHAKGQPVLVGTVSVEKSERLSALLKKEGIAHNVLNAKYHEKEAEIIAQAGKLGAVTISTNMAGRGTDIMLGGNAEFLAKRDLAIAGVPEEVIAEATGFADTDNEEILMAREMFADRLARHKAEISGEADKVREAGGLFILGTERHESRRIDNQLRGRAGRQGDPGETRFFIALTDDILRLFGGDRLKGMMSNLMADDDSSIDSKIFSNGVENAQKLAESRNFQIRKNTLEYDDVMNKQRELIYEERRRVLDGEDVRPHIQSMLRDVINTTVQSACAAHGRVEDRQVLEEAVAPFLGTVITSEDLDRQESELIGMKADHFADWFNDKALEAYAKCEEAINAAIPDHPDPMRYFERRILLETVDDFWMDHIDAMDELRQGVSLRGYGQRNPVDEYKREGFDMFEAMIAGMKEEIVKKIFIIIPRTAEDLTIKAKQEESLKAGSMALAAVSRRKRHRSSPAGFSGLGGGRKGKAKRIRGKDEEQKGTTYRREGVKVGRNDLCPCGSGKKYKHCCGRDA